LFNKNGRFLEKAFFSFAKSEDADKAIEQFLLELKGDKEWEKCGENDRVTVWRKMDDSTGIYRIKMIGHLSCPMKSLETALFIHQYRKTWDQVIEDIMDIDELPDGAAKILYIITKVPPGITPRDFVHLRRLKEFPKDNSKVVLDVSTVSEKAPEKEGFIRAHTIFSGAILCPDYIPNMVTKQLDEGTKYSMISQVDLKGYIPKSIVNWALAYTTMEWFESLYKACNAITKGELQLK